MRLLIARGVADRWKGLCLDGVTPSFHATPPSTAILYPKPFQFHHFKQQC